MSARGERSEARGFGMEYRRADTRQRRHGQYARERGGIGQPQQPEHRDGHARRQSPRRRALVEIESGQRLKDRTGQLINQRDEPDLGETERQVVLQHRIDGRNDRLQRIVEKVRHAQSPQNAECDAGRSPASVPIHRKIVLNGSSVAVRSSPFRKRQNPASGGSPAKNRPKVRISSVHPTESRSESSRSMSGRSPFATSGLFLRSLRQNTVPHRSGLPDASETKASRMVARSFRMRQSQRMPDPPQRFLTGHFPLSCFLPYRKRLILCVGVFSKPSWFSTTTEMREKRFTLELT